MLNKILKTKKEEIALLELPTERRFSQYSLYKALKQKGKEVALIAEVKKASPSKGVIREDFDPISIAKDYQNGGADAISVLTDTVYFQGHRDYLTAIKNEVSIPVLRKDFIIDPIQIFESKRIGADAILLIGEAMEATKLFELYEQAYELGLECLVEVHSNQILEQILKIFTPKIIGVNNRNLATFETTIAQTESISTYIPKESLFVSESGIFTYEDIIRVAKAGAAAVLVGESLMRAETPLTGIQQLFGVKQ
ncbi:indole-3-glycerol phosphate synthase TrpC [Calidifontibacillus oryziterrae]|uniref:indole-3-glycerol phosphate synthase TrpC n=1 Tax=Calidifontibacillus oryziterrae TaxID=1191699 RepID=UPI0002F94FDE|nr:indole-3-glycerol phosphate synthase TrpC [Calidifontibacillus oryziterrae]